MSISTYFVFCFPDKVTTPRKVYMPSLLTLTYSRDPRKCQQDSEQFCKTLWNMSMNDLAAEKHPDLERGQTKKQYYCPP